MFYNICFSLRGRFAKAQGSFLPQVRSKAARLRLPAWHLQPSPRRHEDPRLLLQGGWRSDSQPRVPCPPTPRGRLGDGPLVALAVVKAPAVEQHHDLLVTEEVLHGKSVVEILG